MSDCDVVESSINIDKDRLTQSKENENEGDNVEDYTCDEDENSENVKHPLQNKWALWFYKNDRGNKWEDNLKKVVEFDTVEEFWGLVNHITPAHQLPMGCDYSLFKSGVQPMWEDAANKKGGRWMLSLDKGKGSPALQNYWLDIMMLLIGEAFNEDSEEICGAVVNIRNKGDRLSLWTADCENQDTIMRIGSIVKESLNLKGLTLSYQSHDDQQNRVGSRPRSTYTL